MTLVPSDETKPLIESSTYRSYQSYANMPIEDNLDYLPRPIKAQYTREMDFLSQVDESKGPIKRTIKRMFRIKHNNKEYIYYEEDWYALDWKGADINPVTSIIEGIHKEVDLTARVDERNRKIGSTYKGNHDVYDIPWSREAADQLIRETNSDPEEIQFQFWNKNLGRRDKCNYQQFVTKTWEQASDILMRDGGFELDDVESKRRDSNRDTSHNTSTKK